jgi:hypothetical protein
MPTRFSSLRAWTLPLAVAFFGLVFLAPATQTPPPAAGKAKAATNAPPVEVEPPKSVFIDPGSPGEGKDPFYPQSVRLRPPPPVVTPATPIVTPAVVQLDLKGISGVGNRRFAIINNRTFETGEDGEIAVNSGRVRVVCKEIKDDSVLVLVNGQERTLHLRPGA